VGNVARLDAGSGTRTTRQVSETCGTRIVTATGGWSAGDYDGLKSVLGRRGVLKDAATVS